MKQAKVGDEIRFHHLDEESDMQESTELQGTVSRITEAGELVVLVKEAFNDALYMTKQAYVVRIL